MRWTARVLALAGATLLAAVCGASGEDPAPKNAGEGSAYSERIGDAAVEMAWIAPGSFTMGKDGAPTGTPADEGPAHEVALDGFWIGKFEVTQAEWAALMGNNPSTYKGDPKRPVENVSWKQASDFCARLSRKSGKKYRLPTEAEWEYACRAGTTTEYSCGDDAACLADCAWFHGNSGHRTHPAGEKRPNAWGLYDMLGNVSEWCADRMGRYDPGAQKNPAGAKGGLQRALRGGSWGYRAESCRSASRTGSDPTLANSYVGFRIARSER